MRRALALTAHVGPDGPRDNAPTVVMEELGYPLLNRGRAMLKLPGTAFATYGHNLTNMA